MKALPVPESGCFYLFQKMVQLQVAVDVLGLVAFPLLHRRGKVNVFAPHPRQHLGGSRVPEVARKLVQRVVFDLLNVMILCFREGVHNGSARPGRKVLGAAR